MSMINKQQTAELLSAVLTKRVVASDSHVLDDDTINSALSGELILTDQQKAELLNSPATLKRFRRLSMEKQAAELQVQSTQQESDVVWLRAADSGDNDFDMRGEGFNIYFSRGPDGDDYVRITIDAGVLPEDCQTVCLLDSTGQQVLSGLLDRNDEINGIWPLNTAPREFLQNSGLKLRWS